MSDSAGRSDTYWAADPDVEYVVEKLVSRHETWVKYDTNPIVQGWTRNLMAYYSTLFKADSLDTSLLFGGRQGELVEMMVPQAKALIGELVAIITKRRLAYQTLVKPNGESDALKDARTGNAVIDQVLDQEHVDEKQKTMCEGSLVTGQWYMGALWRQDQGKDHERDEFGRARRKGKIEVITPSVFDVIYNFLIPNWDDVPWADIRVLRNRWDLIAEHPELRDEILGLPSAAQSGAPFMATADSQSDDMVFAYYFIHRPTPALEKGRIVFYSSALTIYSDAPNDPENGYGTIPLEVMRPDPILGVGYGYPFLSNLLPAQEMMDHTFSAIATNHGGLAVKNITAPKGSSVTKQDISGMNLFYFKAMPDMPGGGRPEALDLLGNNNEHYKFISVLMEHMSQLSKINGALRGSPPPGVTSGRAIATLVQNALEFINDTGKVLELVMERVMMHAVNGYKAFAKVDQDLIMYGRNNQATIQTFNKKDLANFAAIKVSAINPLMQTMSGRIDLAKDLRKEGFINTAGEYLQVLDGVSPQKAIKRTLTEQDLIDMENEMLQEGKKPQILKSDDHGNHYMQHLGMLNDPYVRESSSMVAAILAHSEEHDEMARSIDPFSYAMARTGKIPQQQQEAPPPEGEESAGGGPAAMPETMGAAPAEDDLNRDGDQSEEVANG